MNTIAIIIIVIAAVAVIAYFVIRRKSTSPQSVNGLTIPTSFSFQSVSHGGVAVQANVNVPLAALDLIDEGISMQIERSHAEHPEWPAGNGLSEYELIFIDPMAENQVNDPGSPALIVAGQQAAGTCIGSWGTRMIIVLPQQQATNWSHTDYLRESARNESEHIRLGFAANNAKNAFDYFQGPNDIHPIFP